MHPHFRILAKVYVAPIILFYFWSISFSIGLGLSEIAE